MIPKDIKQIRIPYTKAVFRRWLDILLLAICGVLIGWVILSLRFPLPEWVIKNFERLVTGWLGFMLMTLFWAVVLSAGAFATSFSWRSIRWNYPSLTVAVIVNVILGLLVLPSTWPIITPFAAFLIGICIKNIYTISTCEDVNTKGYTAPQDPDLPNDLQWILDEHPVKKPDDDRFERGSIVRRLARILGESDDRGAFKSIGLVGQYGCGKSSISRFVEEEISKVRDDVVFVRVPGWGIADSGLTKFVLQRVIEELEKSGIDCIAIRGLPNEYLAAIEAINDKFGKLFSAVTASTLGPREVLKRITPILEATGLTLVLCIEDVERGAGKDALEELAALLDRFRHVSQMTFIVEANQDSHDHLDLTRICDHIERVPLMSAKKTWGHICRLRLACVSFAKNKGDVLPSEEALHENTTPSNPVEDTFWSEDELFALGFGDNPDVAVRIEIARLVGTPRCFKHGLRVAWNAWKNLHGEVDLRELILLHILREISPDAWNFLTRNIDGLCGIVNNANSKEGKKSRSGYLKEWQELMKGKEEADGALAILRVLDFNFFDEYPGVYMRKGNMQSIHRKCGYVDYFSRILAGEIDDNEQRDQDVLSSINKWKETGDEKLPEKMLNSDVFADKLEQFRNYLGGKDKELQLCDSYLTLVLNLHGVKADDECTGFSVVRRLVTTGAGGGPEYEKWLMAQIEKAFAVSLRVVHSIYMFTERIVGGKEAIRRNVAEELIKRTSENPGYLGLVLDPDYPYTLYHLLRFRKEFPCFNTPEEWQSIVPPLLSAAENNPLIVVPHLANLIIRKRQGFEIKEEQPLYWFENDYAEQLIPALEVRKRLFDVFQRYHEVEGTNPETIEKLNIVAADIKDYVNTKTSDKKDNKALTGSERSESN